MKIYNNTRVSKIFFLQLRSADDPFLVGKLFEFLRDRYTEQLLNWPRSHAIKDP
jgi:hypothetical protein